MNIRYPILSFMLAVMVALLTLTMTAMSAPKLKTDLLSTKHMAGNSIAIPIYVQVVNVPDPVVQLFELEQNFPNPFNASTEIRYSLQSPVHARLDIFNVLGNRIQTLVNENQAAGKYSYLWSRPDLSSGVFYYRLHAGSFVKTRRMILVK